MKYLIILNLLFKVILSSSTFSVVGSESDILPILTDELFYEMILEDKCPERRTDILQKLEEMNRFKYPVDPTGLDRSPLQVAIDNQSRECYNLIVTQVHERDHQVYSSFHADDYKSMLVLEDERGWRPVEHALKYWPGVALHVLPYGTFSHFDVESIKKLIRFAMKNNLLACIYFLRSLFFKWRGKDQGLIQKSVLGMILEVYLELEEGETDMMAVFLRQVISDFEPSSVFDQREEEALLNLYSKAIDRQFNFFLSLPIFYSLVSEFSFEGLMTTAVKKAMPLVFKSLVAAKGLDENTVRQVQNIITTAFPILRYSPQMAIKIMTDYQTILNDDTCQESDFISRLSRDEIERVMQNYEEYKDKMVLAFFDKEFIPNNDLKIALGSSEGIRSLPTTLYGHVPLGFVVALRKPNLVFDEGLNLFGNSTKKDAFNLIACYLPGILKKVTFNKTGGKESLLSFVLSSKCMAPEEIKKESIQVLTKDLDKIGVVKRFVGTGTSWNLFSKSFNEATEAEIPNIVTEVLNKDNFDFAYKILMAKKPPINFEILSGFLAVSSDVNIEYVYDLMELMPAEKKTIESVKVFHDNVIKFFKEAYENGLETKLIGAILPRLWTSEGFDINSTVESGIHSYSVFLYGIQCETSSRLLKIILKLFSRVLVIKEEEKEMINSIEFDMDGHKLFKSFVNS